MAFAFAASLALASGCRTRLLGLRTHVDPDASCDGVAGDVCAPCIQAKATPWQFHDTPGPMCVGTKFPTHGDPAEYAYATIPDANDPGWVDFTSLTIDFQRRSRLCGTACSCSNGVDFDYWQTFLHIDPGATPGSFHFVINNADDGARVTIFNSTYPSGATDPGSYTTLGGATTSNLAPYLVVGENRIVLTHVDDCCVDSIIAGATIQIDGAEVGHCN
jgi:hypothetical protein